jgi:F-type H+-transporting ATPase subunit gamma
MELVSAAKMKRAIESVTASRPYAKNIAAMLQRLSPLISTVSHPLLRVSTPRRILVVIFSSDRGLCGSLNSAVAQATLRSMTHMKTEFPNARVEAVTMGRKAREVVRRSGIPVIADFPRPHRQPHPADILPLSRLLVEEFTNEQVDRVVLLTTDFVSALTQRANAFPLLPLASNDKDLAVTAKGEPVTAQSNQYREYLFEPSREDVVATLLPRLVELTLYQALLESVASEHASRRMAMKNATDAAKDIIDDVTLTLNQTRQATITREMAEIATAMTAMAA